MSTTSVLRPRRFRIKSDNVLGVARTIAQLTTDVSDIAQAPVVSQVASLVLSLLDIAKEVKDNSDHRVRLAKSAATYLIELSRILDPQGLTAAAQDSVDSEVLEIPIDLQLRLENFHDALLGVQNYLEAMKKRNILKHIFGKDRISTALLEREQALQGSYNALLLWTTTNTYALVRKAAKDMDTNDIPRFDQAQVFLRGPIKTSNGFLSDLERGELHTNGNSQRVLVKRFANKTERDKEARKWRKLWHANLLQLAGRSSDRSTMQFILFHDAYHASQYTVEIRSLAAYLLELSRSHDVFSVVDKMVDFVNDAISAVRHIQEMLNYDEDETACLATITKYTLSYDGRVIVAPPLQDLDKYGDGVRNSILVNLFPAHGTTELSMRRYFANLDSVPSHATPAEALDRKLLDTWTTINSFGMRLRVSPNGFEKPQQHDMPDTRRALADYSANLKPGDFGVLIPGEREEYAFRRVGDSTETDSALFEYNLWNWLYDRDRVDFDVVSEQPKTWGLDRLTDGCIFCHLHCQNLKHAVHRSKRFLRLSAPKYCGVVELAFVVNIWRFHYFRYALIPKLTGESQVADTYASLPFWNADEIRFRHCAPGLCTGLCEHCLDSQIVIEKDNEYMEIEYVTVPVQRHAASLDESLVQSNDNPMIGLFRHKEYESLAQHQSRDKKGFWAEWP